MSNPLIAFPVRRPVLVTCVYTVVLVVGLFSLWRIPIDLMPEVTYPTISVVTSYGSAGPQEVEELVTRPIESALAGIQGIEEITSRSSEGRSLVRASFAWGTNLDEAANDIRDRIDRTLSRLPEDVERPSIRKFDLSAFPVMMLGVESKLEPADVRRLIEDQVQYRLERVDGVASVDVRGGSQREVRPERARHCARRGGRRASSGEPQHARGLGGCRQQGNRRAHLRRVHERGGRAGDGGGDA
jgi:HAE1 family hydrophobic/amphiphilic exporter-1